MPQKLSDNEYIDNYKQNRLTVEINKLSKPYYQNNIENVVQKNQNKMLYYK